MKIVFDQGTPVPLSRFLAGHLVDTAFDNGWSNLQNGELLRVAEQCGYDLLITTDQNLKYQQQLTGRKLAVLVLKSTDWRRIQNRIPDICQAIDATTPGGYAEVPI